MTLMIPGNQWSIELTLSPELAHTTIVLGRGILAQAPDLFDVNPAARLLLVTDEQVEPLWSARLRETLVTAGYRVDVLLVPRGEPAKTLPMLTSLYQACYQIGVERDDVVIAVGGGAVGDVAGMLAGTYLRGLRFIQVPTSLVAMISASVGGKVGLNFASTKNIVGLFKHPTVVLADPDTLSTLPNNEFRSGLGELITVGVLGAPSVFESLEEREDYGAAQMDALIATAIACKVRIVEADPLDRLGIRAQLNLGHTFGHALERLSNFTLPHGVAVGIGLHIASRLAAALYLCPPSLPERIRRTLSIHELPVAVGGYTPEAMRQAMRSDKKSAAGQLRWVLPTTLGHTVLVSENNVAPQLLDSILRALVFEGRDEAWEE